MSGRDTLSVLDYVVFSLILVAPAFIGIYFAWKARSSQSTQNFLMGNRQLSVFPVAMSLLASFLSAVGMLGVPAITYYQGMQFAWSLPAAALALLITCLIFFPVFYDMKLNSINEYLDERFQSKTMRLIGSISFIVSTIPYLGMALYAPSLALGSVTGLSIPMCVLVNGLICTLYTSIGGMKAVVWTDVLQMILMTGGIVLVMVKGLYETGGFKEAWAVAEQGGRTNFLNFNPSLYTVNVWGIILGSVTNWLGTYAATQTQVQRYCVVPTKKMARLALLVNIPGILLISGMEYVCGMALYAYYSTCDPLKRRAITKADQIAPYFVFHKFRDVHGIPGLYVAAIFSGSLSTLSSGFNSLSAVTWNDLIKPYCPKMKERKAVWVAKGCSAMFGIMAIGAAFASERISTLIESYYYLIGGTRGPIIAVFLLGLCCPWANAKGALMGYITSLVACFTITGVSLYYPTKQSFLPTSVENCSSSSSQEAPWLNVSTLTMAYRHEPVSAFVDAIRINAMFLPCLGFLMCFSVGTLVSILSGGNKGRTIDPMLFTPTIRRFLKSKKSLSSIIQSSAFLEGTYKRKAEPDGRSHSFSSSGSRAAGIFVVQPANGGVKNRKGSLNC